MNGIPATRARAFALLGLVVVLWGVNWPVMKIGVQHIPPIWFAVARILIGAACLFAILAVLGRLSAPVRRDRGIVAAVGLIQIAAVVGLIHSGILFLEPGRSAILAYTTPLWVAPMAVFWLGERLTPRRAIGLALGMVGLGFLFEPTQIDYSDAGQLAGNAFLLLAAVAGSVAMVLVRRHRFETPVLDLMPWQMLLGGACLVPLALAVEGPPDFAPSATVAAILVYNGPIASALCFWAVVTAMNALPAVTTSLGLLGVPVVGLLSSIAWLGEDLPPAKATGLILIVAGIAAVALAERAERRG